MDLNQVTVPIKDLDRSVAFYQALGLHLITYADHGYARFECPGGSTFSLHVHDGEPSDFAPVIYFETERLDEVVQELKAEGVQFDTDPTDQGWFWREARLRDPDGNQLVLYWAGVNRRFPPWRIEGEVPKADGT